MMVKWVEPGPNGETLYQSCSESYAIDAQKTVAEGRGYTYANDQAALDDFIAVHWAWIDNGADFDRFWCEVKVFVLLDTLMLVKDQMLHPCFFKRNTLFDIRRTILLCAVWETTA